MTKDIVRRKTTVNITTQPQTVKINVQIVNVNTGIEEFAGIGSIATIITEETVNMSILPTMIQSKTKPTGLSWGLVVILILKK